MLRKKRASRLLALVIVCTMMFAPFVGLLGSRFVPASENSPRVNLEREKSTLSLADLPLTMSAPLVYDSESDKMVYFGGFAEILEAGPADTWSYDYNTNEWTNMSPALHPSARAWQAMAYHSDMDRIVLFGGHKEGSGHSAKTYHDTWVYDLNSNTWTNMTPATSPPGLAIGCMTYDSESGLMILFGGVIDGSDSIAETWTYNLGANIWTNVTTSIHPSSRIMHTMTYDSESDLVVFFGGEEWYPLSLQTVYDTWTYDANSNTWTEKAPAQHPTTIGCFAYDDDNDKAVFFGGSLGIAENEYISETWTYDCDTDTWQNKNPSSGPDPRARVVTAYDSESDKTILFGGALWAGWDGQEEVLHDCWSYDLSSNIWNNVEWDWQEMTPAISPGTRCCSPLVYDIESDRMVIFSGWPDLHSDGVRYNDTWTYDYNTNTWTNMSPSVLPPGRGAHAMAYDEKADVMVMFGGVTGYQIDYDKWMADTWTYDLNTNTWTNMSPASNPPPRAYASMAYDNKSDVIVMFGGWQGYWGNTYHDTWIYNLTSNTWANVTTSIHPGGRLFGSMMYDYGNGRILLGGGTNWDIPLNDIWEFNFTTNSWTELIPSTSVPTFATALTYDIESNIIVANGGPTDAAEEVFVQETWKFNLTSGQWNNSYSPNNPPPRSRHYLAYDIESDRTIMYGGALPNGAVGEALGDTWSYDHRVNPPLLAPDHVNNLRVIPGPTNDALIITWEVPDPIAGVTIIGYNVYRGSESGVYELLVELGDVHTYTDLTVGFGITYYYVVTAVATTGESDFPDEVSESLDLVPYDDGVHTFIAYGDTRASDSTAVAAIHDDLVSRYLQLSDPEMIIHTGDMVYHGGEVEQFPLFNDSISAIWEWDPNMKFYGAVGNHEWYTDAGPIDEDFSNYIDLFDSIYANAIDEPGETELWYSYDWQGIHFIFLNTIEGWDGEEFTCPTEQMTWLMNDLAGNHEFIIVSMHNPCYSIRADRPDRWAQAAAVNNTFHDIFVDNGVDIVFTGHDHQYYRTVRDDIHFIVTGGGGAPLYDVDTEGPVWQEGDFGFSDYHYCVCELNPLNETHNRLTVEVVLMDGTVMDTFHEDLLKPPVTTTTTTGTATQPPFPWVLTLVVTGAAVAVIVVLVLIMRKRK